MSLNLPVLLAGMTMSLGLIVAIGAQNAFVLRQGLRKQHVFLVCLTCAVSDALLILLGATSFARIRDGLLLPQDRRAAGGCEAPFQASPDPVRRRSVR